MLPRARKIKKVTASERSAARIYRITDGLWRAVEEPVLSVAEGTPAMLVGRCSSQLSSHKLQAKSKKSQAPTGAQRSGGTCCFLILLLDLFIFGGLYGMPEDLLEALRFYGVGFAVVFVDFVAIAHAGSGKAN